MKKSNLIQKRNRLWVIILIVILSTTFVDDLIALIVTFDVYRWYDGIDSIIALTITTPLFYNLIKHVKQYEKELKGQLKNNEQITKELHSKNHELSQSEKRYRHLLEISPNAISIQSNGSFIYANRAALNMIGARSLDELVGRQVSDFIPPEYQLLVKRRMEEVIKNKDVKPIEYPVICLNGKMIMVESNITNIEFMDKMAYLAVVTDITERKEMEKELHTMAYYDPLTGLANRYFMHEYLEKALETSRTTTQQLAVMFLDLDRFKLINDSKGHETGDILLKQASDRLIHIVGKNTKVSRQGGDEFIILLENVEKKEIIETANRIIEAFADAFVIHNEEYYTTPSIGVSVHPQDGEDRETLIKHADSAMYLAKKRGRNNAQFFVPDSDNEMDRKRKLENGLRKALENEELSLFYQPKMTLKTREWQGVEALIRWNHPKEGFVSPGEFIPIAEETGLILGIGKWVMETACKQMKEWRDLGFPFASVAVNVSVLQYQDKHFVSMVKEILERHGLPPECLELEITESVMQDMEESLSIMNNLKQLGVKLSIDDFGTGYSSLNILNHLPIDFVKIDQSFVSEVPKNKTTASLVETMIQMGANLRFQLIAEGVENKEQETFLREKGCQFGQGYFYSRPLPKEGIENLVKKR